MEAVVVIIVPLIAFAIYLGARFSAQGRPVGPQEELTQLQERLAWHKDRLQRAKDKNWDDFMISQIADQLAATRLQIACYRAGRATALRRV